MIKYRTRFDEIKAVEILRETPQTVVFANSFGKESRESKRSDWVNWHDTWEEAHAFLIGQAERKVAGFAERLEREKAELAKIKAMTKGGAA